MVFEEYDFYDDLKIRIANESEYFISTDFNCIKVCIEMKYDDENGYVIIKEVSTERVL